MPVLRIFAVGFTTSTSGLRLPKRCTLLDGGFTHMGQTIFRVLALMKQCLLAMQNIHMIIWSGRMVFISNTNVYASGRR